MLSYIILSFFVFLPFGLTFSDYNKNIYLLCSVRFFGDTRDLKEHIDEVTFVTNYFPVYRVHELIEPY